MEILLNWLISSLLILAIAYILPGVTIAGFFIALLAALVIGIINALIKPLLFLLTLPINILTLGLFTFVINTLLIMLAAAIVPGFSVANFGWAFLFSILLSIFNLIVNKVFR